MVDGIGALLVGRELNPLRASLGMKPMRRMFHWWWSPELIIGMFPEWFGQPQRDWPPQLKLAGFPLKESSSNLPLPEQTIKFCRAGDPPIAFTFGSGMMHASELFQNTIEACRLLGKRGLLLTRFPCQLPGELPPFVHHCEFATFEPLFPMCAAVVHHGGIGTVAKALAAGKPQLILPFAYDQMDNALRVQKLSAGNWLRPAKRSANTIAAALKKLLSPPGAPLAQSSAARFSSRNGLRCAADLVDEFRSRMNSQFKTR